ncbi:hypothetical protein [Spongorhabdus nitratireducens]
MNSEFLRKVLLAGYSLIAALYFYGFINKVLENPTGNRTLGALLVFLYMGLMSLGLYKYPKAFLLLSAANFMIGFLAIIYLIYFGLPAISAVLIALTVVFMAGFSLSLMLWRVER